MEKAKRDVMGLPPLSSLAKHINLPNKARSHEPALLVLFVKGGKVLL